MAPISISDERTVALPAERVWKVFLDPSAMPKVCAGFIDAVEVKGDGGPGTVRTMKVNPAVKGGGLFKSHVVACDNSARVIKLEVLDVPDGSKVGKLKSHLTEAKIEAAGVGTSVAKLKVDYELEDGSSLSPEKEKIILNSYFDLLKMVEDYLVAHPTEYA
ncbi:hypothetical protein E2562_022872 [Oryza meyeriana var. granulata]|uniref:Bet v I/Major latex protein domain-containing protein n=1 Tax=Oryza meyeriana var. granulata TaxID=110450 RepID=A0A6G1BNI2_9ORYZ|nr:hypothetical protein E2562_022872 [Oryza meyeriana var. granulata]